MPPSPRIQTLGRRWPNCRARVQGGDAKSAKGYLDQYFEPTTVRTPATAYSALTLGAQVERQLGNRKRAEYYDQVLKTNFHKRPTPESCRT